MCFSADKFFRSAWFPIGKFAHVIEKDFNFCHLLLSLSFPYLEKIPRILTGIRDEGSPDCNFGYYDTFDLLVTL